jgi:phage protein D/phage baseplate assembly protein gpV
MPDFGSTLKGASIKIGGQELSDTMWRDVLELAVETTLSMPDMFTLKLHDDVFSTDAAHWVDDASLDVGKEVVIAADETQIFKGEITALEPDFDEMGRANLLLRGYDKSHRLHLGRQTRTFLKKTDSAIASTVAQEAGLTAVVDATSVTHDWVLQNNQTNMEFLQTLAQRNGYQVFVADGKLYFKKGDSNQGAGPELTWGETLYSFRPRLTTAHQAKTAIVRGWDPATKAEINSEVTQSLTQAGVGDTGGAKATSAFQEGKEYVVAHPVATVDEAKALATGLAHDLAREFIQAEGVCEGHPDLIAGKTVTITGVGTRFGGSYFVTSATHLFDRQGRYQTHFSISGRQPHTLSYLLGPGGGNGHGPGQGLVLGVVPAMVTNLNDPDDLGRIKVKYPWLPKAEGAEIESFWARIAAPMAGGERGFYYLPEVDDEVLVAFEHGDPRYPYIVGGLWGSTDKPPLAIGEAVAGGKVKQRSIKSTSGHVIILDDTTDAEKVSVTSKSGHTVILDDTSGSETITIKDKTGKNSMIIDSKKNSMTIAVNGDFTVDAKGKVTINSAQAMSIESKATANIKSTGNMTVEGTAGLTAKNAAAEIAMSGPTVNINKGALEVT